MKQNVLLAAVFLMAGFSLQAPGGKSGDIKDQPEGRQQVQRMKTVYVVNADGVIFEPGSDKHKDVVQSLVEEAVFNDVGSSANSLTDLTRVSRHYPRQQHDGPAVRKVNVNYLPTPLQQQFARVRGNNGQGAFAIQPETPLWRALVSGRSDDPHVQELLDRMEPLKLPEGFWEKLRKKG